MAKIRGLSPAYGHLATYSSYLIANFLPADGSIFWMTGYKQLVVSKLVIDREFDMSLCKSSQRDG
jgi:hypothetical protein